MVAYTCRGEDLVVSKTMTVTTAHKGDKFGQQYMYSEDSSHEAGDKCDVYKRNRATVCFCTHKLG